MRAFLVWLTVLVIACSDAGNRGASPPDAGGSELDGGSDAIGLDDGALRDASGNDASLRDASATDAAIAARDGSVLWLYVSTSLVADQIHVATLDPVSAASTKIGMAPASSFTPALAASRNQRLLYGLGRERVTTYAIDPAEGALTSIAEVSLPFTNSEDFALEPQGRWMVIASEAEGLVVRAIGADGRVADNGPVAAAGPGASRIVAHPRLPLFYLPSCDADRVRSFALDTNSGALAAGPSGEVAAGSGSLDVAFHPTLPVAYVMNLQKPTVTSFALSPDGALSEPKVVTHEPVGDPGSLLLCDGGRILVHPSGRFVYVVGTDGGGFVSVLAVDPSSGQLSLVERNREASLRGAHRLATDPEGKLLLVGNGSGSLHIFRIDPVRGGITHAGFTMELAQGATSMVVVPL